MSGKYLGDLKVELCHEDSAVTMTTVAPKDNNGDGSSFSPTDLFCASLGACMLTIMGIVAKRDSIPLDGAYFDLSKEMATDPRRVKKITVEFHLPSNFSPEYRMKLERAAYTCPVHHSIHPDVECVVTFNYNL